MMSWNLRKTECDGGVYYRGAIAPQLREFDFLTHLGVTIRAGEAAVHEAWAAELEHPQWGSARVAAPRLPGSVPEIVIRHDARLDGSEKSDALLGKSQVQVRIAGDQGDVLRDRKRLLRFLSALMGDDGLISFDATAMRFWSRAALADELVHDADLDIDSLFTVHAVTNGSDKRVTWYHTHGLAEIGFFDFDILNPSPDLLTSRCHDFARAMAFGIVEGKIQPSMPVLKITSGGPLRLVEIAEFNLRASKADRALRGSGGDDHNRNRSVLCDPATETRLAKIFGIPAAPSRMLSSPQGDFMVYFPTNATRLMSRRARQTYGVFRALTSEFAELKAKPIVKLGFEIEGGNASDLEHMWFEVHQLHEDGIDATLVNQPHRVPGMRQGMRDIHPLDRLTDWMLLGPTGSITPRDTRPARAARTDRERILRSLAKRSSN